MDLMTLAAKITLDDKSYQQGVKNAESMGERLSGKMSAMTVAVGTLAADMVKKGVGAISGVLSGAVDGFADYQQLVGGVETLFKDSAGKVAKYAKESYKTTGLSANDYMETVTSFSASLLQGLGGDTNQAAEMANTAITDMADNANKMGTDISAIQTAYQGFAKQNYTMLDNLKLGYGGTQAEMVRLINDSGILGEEIEDLDNITFDQIIEAIHKIQTEMGITGTTAQEAAATISGSKASLEASWADFLAAVGGETDQARIEEAAENFKSAFNTYVVNNLAPAIGNTMKNAPELIEAVSDAITSLPSKAITTMIGSGIDIFTAGVNAATDITTWLVDGLVDLFTDLQNDNTKVVDLGNAIGEFIGTAISSIVTNAGTIADGIFSVGLGLAEGLANGLFSGLFGEEGEAKKISNELDSELLEAEYHATQSSAILEYLEDLAEKYGNAVTSTTVWKDAVDDLEQHLPGAKGVLEDFGEDVGLALSNLDGMVKKMKEAALTAALTKALQGSYELVAQQNVDYRIQKNRYDRKKSISDTVMEQLEASVQAEAQKQLDEIKAGKRGMPFGNGLEQLAMLAKGQWNIGGEEGLTFGLSELEGNAEEWKKIFGLFGDDASAQMTAQYKTFQEAQTEMKEAQSKMTEISKEIDATWETINDVNAAVKEVAPDLSESFGVVITNTITGGAHVITAFDKAASKIQGWEPGQGLDYAPKAVGMDYVPYDGFRAELHRGEAILPRAEAENYRNGGGIDLGALENSIAAAIRNGMENATVRSFINGKDITDEVNRNMIQELKARRFSS